MSMGVFEELSGFLTDDKINMIMWYDDTLFICQDILEEFTTIDWERLVMELSKENDAWKKIS